MIAKTKTFSYQEVSEFQSQHRLPAGFQAVAEKHYLPLARRLLELQEDGTALLVGISGEQGTGKSTLADFLCRATESMFNWNVAVLSIDDFYLTLEERLTLAAEVHPLLCTRGVPGTHDTDMLAACLDDLRRLQNKARLLVPRFDKAADDRADRSRWSVVTGPVDLIILEGWCVGSEPQSDAQLLDPTNTLEHDDDPDGIWRSYANEKLGSNYQPIFDQLAFLIYLRAPSFEAILRWRLNQERKLAEVSPLDSFKGMNEEQVRGFMRFFERLTRHNRSTLEKRADVVIKLNHGHSIDDSNI